MTKEFQKYGKVLTVSVPMKNDKVNRGFAFVEYENKEIARKAIDAMNGKKWKGRTLAIEVSVPIAAYQSKLDRIVEHTNMTKIDASLPKVLRDEKKEVQAQKDKEEKEKQEYLEKNATKIRK